MRRGDRDVAPCILPQKEILLNKSPFLFKTSSTLPGKGKFRSHGSTGDLIERLPKVTGHIVNKAVYGNFCNAVPDNRVQGLPNRAKWRLVDAGEI